MILHNTILLTCFAILEQHLILSQCRQLLWEFRIESSLECDWGLPTQLHAEHWFHGRGTGSVEQKSTSLSRKNPLQNPQPLWFQWLLRYCFYCIIIMNFLKSLVTSYIGSDEKTEVQEEYRRKQSSGTWEVIDEEDNPEFLKESQFVQISRQPTRYYMIENEFFNNVIVEKDENLKVLSLEQWKDITKRKSLEGVCQKNILFSMMKGIPNEVRKELWEVLADTEAMKKRFNISYYNLLDNKESKDRQIIEKDVPRTRVDEKHREKLFNILMAYSNIDPMGYTQGMNLICGSLLNILSSASITQNEDPELELDEIGFEEKVFWVFMGIMYGKNWRQCFEEMKGVKRMLQELEELMSKHTPDVLQHMKELDVDLNMCFAQYYLTLVIYNTPIQFATIILDLFLLEGQIVIHSIIMKMIMACRQKILEIDDMGMLVKFFKTDMLQYCHQETKKQGKGAESLEDFIINFFTLTTQ